MAKIDFEDQWDVMVDYVGGAEALNLAALGAARPRVVRDDTEQSEEVMPVLVVSMLGSAQARDRAAGQNTHQTFNTRFHFGMAATGPDLATANSRCLAILSALIEDFVGIGAFAGTNRSKLFAVVVDSWDWDPASSDSMVAQAFVDATATFYRN